MMVGHFCMYTGPFPAIWGKAPGLNWEKYAAFWVILGIFLEV